ncbi:hypothetical protein [Oceanicoccus sp. KOV_DT_Chl]|uniref:hypothetical protein n=1 Tax=Oceanicoccus sp. KOV_DT_Chl TaxID=1904639 RepID=UPI000C7AC857|nr:hypothetical protein [Oceanicoccus sp. KOV_DT_Chl]
MRNNIVTVFCAGQSEVNQAVHTWVNVKGYTLRLKAEAEYEAAHFQSSGAGAYGRSACTPADKYKIILVFEGD